MPLLDTWQPIFKRRADIYHWFSGLFAQELSEEQFLAYQGEQAKKWLNIFEKIGLKYETQYLREAIIEWKTKGITAIDLQADFAESFLLGTKTAAIPYASFYLEKNRQLYGKMESEMCYFLSKNHLQIHSDFKEPADHLSVYLALLNNWCSHRFKSNEIILIAREQSNFLQQALLTWLPQFVKKCQTIPTDSNFYAALTQLLLAFIQSDIGYLQLLQNNTDDQK